MSANLVGATPLPQPPQKSLRISPQTFAALLALDVIGVQMQATANLLGGMLKQTNEADILVTLIDVLAKRIHELKEKYSSPIQVVSEIPKVTP